MYIYESENKSVDVKKQVNTHIKENWNSFYQYKVCFPYITTVGVGFDAKEVRFETEKEFLSFLSSEEALHAYSDSQEAIALANIYNIDIHIFKYGFSGQPERCEWSIISPHPEMQRLSRFPQGWLKPLTL